MQNEASQKVSGIAAIIDAIDEEMSQIEVLIRQKERWEHTEEVRQDALAEAGTIEAMQGATEVVRVGHVVGAEAERERLETLIRRRARLTGGDVEMRLAEAGFGGQFGGSASELGGHAQIRFADKDAAGLHIKGKKVAEWQA